MVTTIALREAIRRIIEAEKAGLSRKYDNRSICDGDPYDIPPEGRVHIGHRGTVSIDLPNGDADGFSNHELGRVEDIDALRLEALATGDTETTVWIDIIQQRPVNIDTLDHAFGAAEEDICRLITKLARATGDAVIDAKRIAPEAAMAIHRELLRSSHE